jgi:ribonuclease HI
MKAPLKNTIYVYTDGACSKNPGPGGYGAILYLDGKVKELGGAAKDTTNNRMEMTAILKSLKALSSKKEEIRVYTDSMYFINGITKWIFGWKQNGWKTGEGNDVLNKDLWKALDATLEKLKSKVIWFYVPGHSDFMPNERVDDIAVAFSKGKNCKLYSGDYSSYDIDLFKDIKKVEDGEFEKSSSKSNSNKGKKAYSYVSRVNGIVEVHKTWAECEAKVKGQSGAKFKKALNVDEERELIKKFKG